MNAPVIGCSWAWSIDGEFRHLHVRSGFSYGFGTSTPEELVETTAEVDVGSVALTDRDGLYGIPRFLKAAGEAGILPSWVLR